MTSALKQMYEKPHRFPDPIHRMTAYKVVPVLRQYKERAGVSQGAVIPEDFCSLIG